MENNRNEKATFHNPIEKFLALCSGASVDILKECPRTEVIKHAGIGGTILITSLLALISGSYALFTIFKSFPAAILFGLVWALMIFNLDRLIVSSMRKRGSWGDQFKMAIPRILLALVIAIVISKPLEVRLLQTRINKVLNDEVNHKVNLFGEEEKELIATHNQQIKAKDDKVFNLKNTPPAIISILKKDKVEYQNKLTDEIATAKRKNKPHYSSLDFVRKRIEFYQKAPSLSVQDLSDLAKLKSQKKSLIGAINGNNAPVEILREKIAIVDQELSTELGKYKGDIAKLQKEVNNDKGIMIANQVQKMQEFQKRASSTIKIESTNSLIDQLIAMSKASNKDSVVFWTSWFIMLLFIVVETAPIFVKLISPRGPYDALLDASEYKTQVQAQSIMKMLDAKEYEVEVLAKDTMNIATHVHNKKFDLLAKIDEQDIKQELSNNKAILETISNAHHVLIKDQVDDWLEKERAKLKGSKSSSSSNGKGQANGVYNGSSKSDYV